MVRYRLNERANEKIKKIGFSDRWFFICLCALASSGIIKEDTQDSYTLNRIIGNKLEMAPDNLWGFKKRLKEAGLIKQNWFPVDFEAERNG